MLEHKSLLKASELLDISQPALSKSIVRLEHEYGARLFERLPRGVRATEFAIEFEYHARRMLADFNRSLERAKDVVEGRQGKVLVGTGPMFVPSVNAAVKDTLAIHPQLSFSIVEGHNAALRSALLAGRIDFYVAMISGAEDAREFRIRRLTTDRIVCVCRHGHELISRAPKAEDLLAFGWVLPEEDEIGRVMIESYFRQRNLPPMRVDVTTNSDRVARYFLRESNLIGLMPAMIVEQPEYRDIVAIPLKDFSLERNIGIVSRPGQHFSRAVERFESALAARLTEIRR